MWLFYCFYTPLKFIHCIFELSITNFSNTSVSIYCWIFQTWILILCHTCHRWHCVSNTWKHSLRFCLFENQNFRVERDFHLLVLYLSGHIYWDWTGLKPGAWSLIWISHVGARANAIVLSSAALPGSFGSQVERAGLKPVLIWDAVLEATVQPHTPQHQPQEYFLNSITIDVQQITCQNYF